MCLLARSFSSKTSTLLHSFRSRSFLTKSLLPAGPKAYSAVLSAYRCQLRPVCVSRMVGRKREWFLPRSPGCGRWSAVAGRSSRPRGSNPQCSDACGRSPSGRKMVRQRVGRQIGRELSLAYLHSFIHPGARHRTISPHVSKTFVTYCFLLVLLHIKSNLISSSEQIYPLHNLLF